MIINTYYDGVTTGERKLCASASILFETTRASANETETKMKWNEINVNSFDTYIKRCWSNEIVR